MWRLLKGELSYQRGLFLFALVVTGFLFGFVLSRFPFSYPLVKARNPVGMVFFLLIVGRGANIMPKRARAHILLPVSVRKLASGRLLTGLTFWIFVVVVVAFCIMFDDKMMDHVSLWTMVCLAGVLLTLNAAVLIVLDRVSNELIQSGLLLSVLIVCAFSGFWFITGRLPSTPEWALLLNLLALGLSCLSIFVFSDRRSYLR